jgi:hypothetical protein
MAVTNDVNALNLTETKCSAGANIGTAEAWFYSFTNIGMD